MRRYVINKYIAVAGNANGADEQLNGAMSGQREQCQNRGENAHIFFFCSVSIMLLFLLPKYSTMLLLHVDKGPPFKRAAKVK